MGDFLKQKRKEKGLKVEKVALYANISEGYLFKLEQNEKENPSAKILFRLARVLDVPIKKFEPFFLGEVLKLEEEIRKLKKKALDNLVNNLQIIGEKTIQKEKLKAQRNILREMTE